MSDSDTTPPPSPVTERSSEQAANSIRVPRDTRSRRRVNSLPPTRRTDFEFRRTESRHPNATRRKSCCQRLFSRWASKKRKKKCRKKCKTRKKKRKKRTKRTKKRKRKKRTKKNA